MTVQFTKNKQSGRYDAIGPVDLMKVGRDVVVTKADGTTTTASKPFIAKFGPNEGKQVCIGNMTTREAAAKIGCSVGYVVALVKAGKLKARQQRTEANQHGYVLNVDVKSVEAFRATPKVEKRGFPRGQKRNTTRKIK